MTQPYSIEGFDSLSRQQLFDMSAAHILSTKRKSCYEDAPKCFYSGSGCGAAVFIKPEGREVCDNSINGTWEGLASDGLVSSHEAEFVQKLQWAHDDASSSPEDFLDSWKTRMRGVAAEYRLADGVLARD